MGKLGQCKMMGSGLETRVEGGGGCLWYRFVILDRVIKTSLSDKATFEERRKTLRSSKLYYVHSAPSPKWVDSRMSKVLVIHTCYVSDAVLNALSPMSHQILTMTLWSWYHLYFSAEEIETQKGYKILSKII